MHSNMTTIDSFPNDNIERVVYLYSCIKLNTSSESDNILVEILLIELDRLNPNRLKVTKDSYDKYDVTFRDLDTVQIGSIWKGQKLIEERKFTFNECLKTITFEFDFSINKPKIIRFDEKIPNSEEYYLFNEKIFIPKNENKSSVPSKYYPFLMSKYCILKSNDNIEVLTNCIHALHAFYLPARKDIRGHLINENYSLSHIVDLFLSHYEIQDDENGEKLFVILKENAVKAIGKEAITLLANLALNKNTQERVLNIRQSLNDIMLDKNGRPYPTRFPNVMPPHSTIMRISATGIWLDENRRFLITHTSNVTPIADYPIKAIAPRSEIEEKEESVDDTKKSHRQGRGKNNKNNRINTKENPSHHKGEIKKQTDITVDFSDFDIEIIEELNEKESKIQYIEKKDENRKKDNNQSSGDRHGNGKNKPQKSENTEKKSKKSEIDDLDLIFKTLKKMKDQENCPLKNIHCIDKYGNLTEGYSLLQIKPLVKEPTFPSWIHHEIGRSLMFLKLELIDFNDHIYLVDIEKNNKNEAFYAFLFTTKYELTYQSIKKLCEAIEEKKGTKKWFDSNTLGLNQKKAIKHMYTDQSNWTKSFNSIFKNLLKKNF